MFKFKISLRKLFFYLLAAIVLLTIGCSKGTNTGINDETKITGSLIEEVQGNCRFANESDCRPIEIRRGEVKNEEASDTQEITTAEKNTSKTINISEESLLSNCEAGWKCVEKNYRAYQYSNCSWISIEYCIYGCKNGTCNPAPICKLNSFKCNNDNTLKCVDGYEWTLNESCDYKCENGICISKNATIVDANATNSTIIQNLTNGTINTTNPSNSTTNTTNDYISDGCMSVPKYNLTGIKSTDEYFTLRNSCSYQIGMTGWTASDNINGHLYTFPSFNLATNGEVAVVTGSGTNNQTTLYWGRGSAIWNDGGDTLYLNASNGASVLIKILNP